MYEITCGTCDVKIAKAPEGYPTVAEEAECRRCSLPVFGHAS